MWKIGFRPFETNFFMTRNYFFKKFGIGEWFENEIKDDNEKFAIVSAIQFFSKSIRRPTVFRETTRKLFWASQNERLDNKLHVLCSMYTWDNNDIRDIFKFFLIHHFLPTINISLSGAHLFKKIFLNQNVSFIEGFRIFTEKIKRNGKINEKRKSYYGSATGRRVGYAE